MAPATNSPRPDNGSLPALGFWLWWVLATTLGWAVGGWAGVTLGPSSDIILSGFLGIAVGGTAAGLLQWFLLSHFARYRADWWTPSVLIAAALAGIIIFGFRWAGDSLAWITGAGVYGTTVGLVQWVRLRREFFRAGFWIAACTAGWVLGGPAAGLVSWAPGDVSGSAPGGLWSWAPLGAVYGAVSGAAFVWLRKQQPPTQPAPHKSAPGAGIG